MMQLTLAPDLKLPIDAVTQTFAILAKRGVGKTHTATIMAEEMLKVGQPIVVYDPTGAWWGLKSSADGKRPGFPIVVFGGEHADVPLEETAGSTVASVIVDKRIPAILDCGLMRKGARIRFMTDFCETLYHRNREAMHFFVDEAQTIAPQNLKTMPEAARLLGAMEDIVLQGRRRGLGMTIISPRPAVVNTNLRSACEVIIAMQIVAPHDRKAIQEWVDLHGDDADRAKEMMSSLSSLKRGEAWLWSPSWLSSFQRVRFRGRETFDSSATPRVGERIAAPKQLAAIDLDALGAEIKATVEKAKADDPKELRRQITELKRQLESKPAAETKIVEVPVITDQQIEAMMPLIIALQTAAKDINLSGRAWESVSTAWQAAIDHITGRRLANDHPKILPASRKLTAKPAISTKPAMKSTQPLKPLSSIPALNKACLRILTAFYWLKDEEANATKVAFYSGYRQSGSFTEALGQLRTFGFIEGWKITLAGMDRIADQADDKPTGQQLRAWLQPKLSAAANRILDALIEVHPERLTNEQLSEATGYRLSGSFTEALGDLRMIEAAVGGARDGGTKASDVFFND